MNHGFSDVRTTASDAQVKFKLVQELAYFVSRGIEKFGFPPAKVRWASVANALQAALAESMLHGSTERMTATALRQRVLDAYLTEYDANCKLYLKEVVVPTAVTRWDEEEAAIAKRYGAVVPYTTPAPSLDGALEMAWLNLRRAQQRWMTWMCLGSMLHNTPQGRERDSAEFSDFDGVSKLLLSEMRGMEKRVLMFSLLKGGDAAEKARTWLLKTTLCEGMSVMEYLEYDGQLPSGWRSADEQSLRDSFKG